MPGPHRVVVAASEPDAGDARPAARALRDAGFEVIVAVAASPAQVAEAGLQEDADAIGVAGTLAASGVADALIRAGADDVVVVELPRPFDAASAGWLAATLDRRQDRAHGVAVATA